MRDAEPVPILHLLRKGSIRLEWLAEELRHVFGLFASDISQRRVFVAAGIRARTLPQQVVCRLSMPDKV
jgi:hypothetical protein